MATLNGTSGNDVLTGTAGKDSLYGLGGDDTLRGGGGDDYLVGGTDADELYGEADNDWLVGGAGGDRLDGGTGTDVASYVGSDAGVTVNLATGTGSRGHAAGDTLRDIERLVGSSHNDILTGDENKNLLNGGGGADRLYGEAGNDMLVGGAGRDHLDGGLDTDTASYFGSDEAVTVNLATGAVLGGHAVGDTFHDIENLSGSSHNDVLTGDEKKNRLGGGGGDDTLSGGAGDDWLVGEADDDTLHGGADNDLLDGGGGADTLRGGDGNDQLQGGADRDHLYGDEHNDWLVGGAGGDVLDGGAGGDTASYVGSDAGVTVSLEPGVTATGGHAAGDTLSNIEGLVGSSYIDTLTGDDKNNYIQGREGGDHLAGGAGADTASYFGSDAGVRVDLAAGRASGGHAAGDTLSNIEILVGSSHDDILTGDRENNGLHGLGGADTLSGRRGNDWIEGGAGADTLDGGPGEDTLSYAGSDASVEVDLERETARNAAGEGHAAGDRIQGFENVVGSKHDDDLRGSGGSNELRGGEGADVLRGRGGADTLWGGPGADTFVFEAETDSTSSARDVIKDFSSGDRIDLRDLLESGVTFTRTAPFAGVAGAVRYTQQTVSGMAWTDVLVDLDGDSAADLVVRLEGTHDLTASDFLLTN